MKLHDKQSHHKLVLKNDIKMTWTKYLVKVFCVKDKLESKHESSVLARIKIFVYLKK